MCKRQRVAFIGAKMCSLDRHIENIHNGLAADSIAEKKFRDEGGKSRRPTIKPRKITQTAEGTLWEF